MTTPPDPLVGRLIDDRYEAEQRIARGGMATVYRGTDRRLDRQVAIKVMHPHLAESEDFIARFRREARAAARLSHPHVVGVFDQGMWNDSFYLVMEYIDGEDLRARLRRDGTMTLGQALDVTEDVLDALGAAHRRDLVHRDIKPENVMISRDGEVKVADFGLVRARSEATSSHSGTIFGTVEYIAPELAAHARATPGADVYAAGIMLYEMLTGQVPFSAEMPINVVMQHVNTDVPRPSERVPWIPTEIDELVTALTARDPDERLADGDEAVAALRRIRKLVDPVLLGRRAEIERPAVAPDDSATAAINARLPGGTVALPAGAIAAVKDEAERVERPTRVRRNLLLTLLFLLLAAGGGAAWYFLAGPGAYTTMPSVVGLEQDRAVTMLEDAGFTVTVDRQNDDYIPVDEVIRTDPDPQTQVRKGSGVTVVVSDGILVLDTPDVVGSTQDEALTALDGFTDPTLAEAWHETAPAGEVLSLTDATGAEVAPGTSLPHNTILTLTVSKGPEPVTVPDVRGSSQADAEGALTSAGLTWEYGEAEYSETVPEGSVISQSPEPGGDPLYKGDSVTLVLSLGPPLVDVPYVIGLTQADATAKLEEAGFEVEVKYLLGGFLGMVRYQDPGDVDKPQAPQGSTVTITIV